MARKLILYTSNKKKKIIIGTGHFCHRPPYQIKYMSIV